ncbi:hypothetical protein DQG23_04990 [Paenibacillus contaminans]|uniref:DUF4179 domain-containing protein n=2 Tax=Paenibacillus contaminans TaxID=450362 RepID=A0A329MSH5_9BACL|nr:hypothetical protein DQG23_04990 [Paenibacillus contaminans]
MVEYMGKKDQTFIPLQNAEEHMQYPDFDAMWNRLETQLPGPEANLLPVDQNAQKRLRARRVAMIAALTATLAATPVIAALSYNWDSLVPYSAGIRSALQQGLGQSIEKSVTQDGVTLTIHTAVVDDYRTVLLYSLRMKGKAATGELQFAKMELTDSQGRIIGGQQKTVFNKERNEWSGYFEADWAPEDLETDVKFSIRNVRALSMAEREFSLNPFEGKQEYAIGQDGIEKLSIKPVPEGDNVLLSTAVTFSQPEVKSWARPEIGVYKDGVKLEESLPGVVGKPGENGEYTGVLHYRKSDLQDNNVKYKLLYNRQEWQIDKDWTFDLHLDKQKMLSGTVKKELHIPMEHAGTTYMLEQMTATPTQIRITVKREPYARFPLLKNFLDIDGTLLRGSEVPKVGDKPEELRYVFELRPGVQVTAETPVTFVAKHEMIEHRDAKDPIRLTGISEEKKTITTLVGGYSVKWTYFKQDGNLYLQSECDDPAFGKVNQTYMGTGAKSIEGKQVSVNLSGEGINSVTKEYTNFSGTEADIYIFWYYTENPDKELRIKLNG